MILVRTRKSDRLLDGIEEIIDTDPGFFDEDLDRLSGPRVVFVASGHPNTDFLTRAGDARIPVPESLSISPLSLEEFAAVLCRECGASSARLLELQIQGSRESHALSQQGAPREARIEIPAKQPLGFLEAAYHNGKGSPLYAAYLAEDLRSGEIKIGDVSALPEGLSGYHNLQLERRGVLRMLNPVPGPMQTVALAEFRASIEMRHELDRPSEGQEIIGAVSRFNSVDEQLARASVLALLATDSNATTANEISERLRFTVLRGQTPEDCLMRVERELTALAPLLKFAPMDPSGKEGFAIANPSVRRYLNSISGIQEMSDRFAPLRGEPSESTQSDERSMEEVRLITDGNESADPFAAKVENLGLSLKSLFSAYREPFVGEIGTATNKPWGKTFFDGTLEHVVQELRIHGLRLKLPMAINALRESGKRGLSEWRQILKTAPIELRAQSTGASISTRLLEQIREDLQRELDQRLEPVKARGMGSESLLSFLDRTLKTSVLGEYRFARELRGGVLLIVRGTAAAVQPACSLVADVLDSISAGANLADFDSYGMGIDLVMTEFDPRDEMARRKEMNFVFMEIPVIVTFAMV